MSFDSREKAHGGRYRPAGSSRPGAWILAAALAAAFAATARAAETEHTFHRDGVLGTSFDLTVRGGSQGQASACERAILAEIARLNGILNVRDPKSEISRLAEAEGLFKCSPDLFSVMLACESWRIRTSGAFNANVGQLIALWRAGAKAGKLPAEKSLAAAAARLKSPAWRLDITARAVKPLSEMHLSVAGLAKGYVIDKALAAARAKVPGLKGILLDIGGDIGTWSATGTGQAGAWQVGVADPFRSEDNAPPMDTIRVVNQSVATSGSYARFFKIGSKRHSHIIDPRSGWPAYGVVSATVVARNTVAADAAATALCVMSPEKGLALVDRLRQTECLIVDSDGKKHRSRNWGGTSTAAVKPKPTPTPDGHTGSDSTRWPKGYCVTMELSLKRNPPARSGKGQYKRPYVAVMVVDKDNRVVKTVALWVGRKTKRDKELRSWYGQGSAYRAKYRQAVSRATRSAGTYTIVWDGTDDDGRSVKQGTYGLFVEINREHGTHVYMKEAVKCLSTPASARMAGNTESDGVSIRYGPRGR